MQFKSESLLKYLSATLFVASVILAALEHSVGQSIEVVSQYDEAIIAKSVKVEQLGDSVAVMFTDREPGTKTIATLKVTSAKQWASPLLDGTNIIQSSVAGEWLMVAKPGSYRVLLIEFDPERGPTFTYHDVVIKGTGTNPNPNPDPDKPVDPPVGDYLELANVAKSVADSLNDPKTRIALAAAYRGASIAALSYEDTVNSVKNARRLVLSARQGESRNKDWSVWLNAVDMELKKVVPPGDKAAYTSALLAIVKALES